MFDIAPSEFLLVAFVALVVIGPKDLPKAMRVVGYWVGKARGVARQFRSGFDSMVREAELEEMEKRWASENERIMREHPQTATATDTPVDTTQVVHSPETDADHDDHTSEPIMVEKPVVAVADQHALPSASAPEHPADEPKPATDRGPDLFDTPASNANDKTGKSDVASS
ncbi:twin-arginine translocase subunit TatB [Sphingomonas sp. CFBP 13603]|uniref:Sec-independent protein translocase protein TatB n=1 Tax=Sphingomonas sp. CFBP 13603 TaxID=2774040 RepID=UPI00186855D5|nr:Sec-independent protein translocase protein TatB [Sphingomonas sp. CFBP 13603]MBE2991199.1 twin-arginine translocase subunit TatB [Sphingomonas sp. CFBP 13603]